MEITGNDLTIDDVVRVGRGRHTVELSASAGKLVDDSHRALEQLLTGKVPLYGVTLGCGELDSTTVQEEDHRVHQRNIVVSHACGVGEEMTAEQVRAMMVCRLNNLARGLSGVSPSTVDCLIAMLNSDLVPVVPTMGSVGASDLVPLAHMSAALIGEGSVKVEGRNIEADRALAEAGLQPASLSGRDGLALINGLSQTTGVAALALFDARRILDLSVCAALLTASLLYPSSDREQVRTAELKNHETALRLARRFRELVGGEHQGDRRSPLSLRFLPYSTAIAYDSINSAFEVVEAELNAVVDNPLVSAEGWYTNNSGNMSGHRLGHALDQLGLALISVAVATERRISQLLRRDHGESLPPYLIHPDASPGTNYGLMITQYTAASLVAALRTNSISSSIQSMSTGGMFEDLTPMSNYSAFHVGWIAKQLASITCIELMAALQGYACLNRSVPSGLEELARATRAISPAVKEDRLLGSDLNELQEAVLTGRLPLPEII